MIYLFAGENSELRHAAYEKFLKGLPRREEVFKISSREFDPAQVESFYSGPGLFFQKFTVVFSNILDNLEARNFFLSRLQMLQASASYFVFLEGKLPKAVLDAFKVARAEINIFEEAAEKERFNSFLLANALSRRDKLNLWILFRQAVSSGVSLEELSGVLFWKAKDMILKKNLGRFGEAELKNFAGRLSYLLPEARRDGRDAEAAMEQYLLEAF
jgi:DNA polymerase III delta subunit